MVLIPDNKTRPIMIVASEEAGERYVAAPVDGESVIISVFVGAIEAGKQLTIRVDTFTDGVDTYVTIIEFPVFTQVSTQLFVKKAPYTLGQVRVSAIYTGACTFQVYGKAINNGETSVTIQGVSRATAYSTMVGTTSQLVIAATEQTRAGLIIKNNNASGILYIGFTAAEATDTDGYPLGPGESMVMDLSSGVEVWGKGTLSIDARIMEAGA